MLWSKHWSLHISKSFERSGQGEFCHSCCFFLSTDVWQQLSRKQHPCFQLHGTLPVPIHLTDAMRLGHEPWRLGQIPSQLHLGAESTCWHHSYLQWCLSRASNHIVTLSWGADTPGRWHLPCKKVNGVSKAAGCFFCHKNSRWQYA